MAVGGAPIGHCCLRTPQAAVSRRPGTAQPCLAKKARTRGAQQQQQQQQQHHHHLQQQQHLHNRVPLISVYAALRPNLTRVSRRQKARRLPLVEGARIQQTTLSHGRSASVQPAGEGEPKKMSIKHTVLLYAGSPDTPLPRTARCRHSVLHVEDGILRRSPSNRDGVLRCAMLRKRKEKNNPPYREHT